MVRRSWRASFFFLGILSLGCKPNSSSILDASEEASDVLEDQSEDTDAGDGSESGSPASEITNDTNAEDADASADAGSESVEAGDAGGEPPARRELDLEAPRLDLIPASNHAVPFGNGTGVHIADDGRVLFTYSVNLRVHVGISDGESAPTTLDLGRNSGASALAVHGEDAVIILTDVARRRMMGMVSNDFGVSWSEATDLGDGGVGPTVPAACAWSDEAGFHALVAWVAPPEQEDGGPLYVAEYSSDGWSAGVRVGSGEEYSAPTFACTAARQTLVVREEVSSTRIHILRFDRIDGVFGDPETIIESGADPHYCEAGDEAWIGYHVHGSAMAAHAENDGDFESTELDSTGKYVPVGCMEGGHAVVCNGDWDTKELAESKGPGRRILCHLTYDAGATWQSFSPAPGEEEQSVTSVSLSAGGLAILWKAPDGVRLAIYDWH